MLRSSLKDTDDNTRRRYDKCDKAQANVGYNGHRSRALILFLFLLVAATPSLIRIRLSCRHSFIYERVVGTGLFLMHYNFSFEMRFPVAFVFLIEVTVVIGVVVVEK